MAQTPLVLTTKFQFPFAAGGLQDLLATDDQRSWAHKGCEAQCPAPVNDKGWLEPMVPVRSDGRGS